MRAPRTRLAQATMLSLAAIAGVLAGCSDSHGRGDDAGPAIDSGDPAPDSGLVLDAGVHDDGDVHFDAGPPAPCTAQDARAAICPAALCDGPGTWYWTGDACTWVDCGACEGPDCGSGFGTEASCLAAYASCEPALCATTGGDWLWWAEECGHYDCGLPPAADCIVGMPVCDCGSGRRFAPGMGCVDAICPEIDPLPRDVLCSSTGGTWGSFCCDSVCGVPCAAACAGDACDCGPGRIFDAIRGCIDGARCHERLTGETCDVAASRCESGTICCEHCGGAGCFGATCAVPVCDTDPHTDTCGNRDDVP